MERHRKTAAALTFLALAAAIALPYFGPASARRLSDFVAPNTYANDVYRYLSQLNAAHQGRWFPGNDYLKEHANEPALDPKLNQMLAAVWSWPFYPDFRALYLWIGLGTMALWTLAVSLMGAEAVPEGWAPWTFVLVASVVALQENLGRLLHPQMNSFPLLAFLLVAAKKTHDGRGVLWALAAGAAFGLLDYLYIFPWILSGAVLGVLCCRAALEAARGGPSRRALHFAAALAAGLALDAPSLWRRHLFSLSPQAAGILFQNGFLRTRFPPVGSAALYLIAAALACAWIPKGRRSFWICCLLGGLIALDENLLTGLYIESGPTHFYKPLALLLLWTAAAGTALRLPEKWLRRLCSFPVWMAAAVGLLAFQAHNAFASSYLDEVQRLSQYAPALRWLSANAPKGSVVLAEESASSYLAAFTPDFPYVAGYGMVSATPVEEVRARKLAELRFYGMPAAELRGYASRFFLPFWGHGPTSKGNRERALNRMLRLVGVSRPVPPLSQIPAPLLDSLNKEYATVPKAGPFLGYELDYVLWGPSEKALFPGFDPASRPDLKKVWSDGPVSIWKWRPWNAAPPG